MQSLPPSLIALALQLSAWFIAVLAATLLAVQIPPFALALLAGLIAALLSHLAGLARWWLPIQLLFAPALVVTLSAGIPPGVFLFAFLLMLLVYWSTFRTQVPLYLSSEKVWLALETLLPPDRPFKLVDLGSGMGGVLTHLARSHPHGHFHGVETAPVPFVWSWLRIKLGGYKNCSVHWQSLWDCDLAQYNFVFAYLSPVPMSSLWEKVQRELQPGGIFISNTFAVAEQPPSQTLHIDDLHHSKLHVWRK